MEIDLINKEKQGDYVTVSEISRAMNGVLEKNFREVLVQGEISEGVRAASGHFYFTLKDERSQLSCVMWKGMLGSLPFVPKVGAAVLCHGKPNIYNANGRLQLVIHYMALAGEGLLQKKFLELKAKLEKEGLFSPDRKRQIPFFPNSLGVVTSSSGAVIHDIMVKIRERMPSLPVFLIDVRVQGDGAANEIAEAIERFNLLNNVDVIIVARGGGSLEDLWAFNEEKVVRAIFASKIPVVSGVGHEVDITLSDLVSDLRAPTPTAAAEMVVPKRTDLLKTIADFERRLSEFGRWLDPLVQRIDELSLRLDSATINLLKHARLHIDSYSAKVQSIEPTKLITLFKSRIDLLSQRIATQGVRQIKVLDNKLDNYSSRLKQTCLFNLKHQREKLETLAAKCHALSPQRVLERGFSVVEIKSRIVTSSNEIKPGDQLDIRFAQGRVSSIVEKISNT